MDLNSARREVCNTWCDVGKFFEFFLSVNCKNSRWLLLINSNHKLMSWKFQKRKLLIKKRDEGDGEARGTILSASFHPSVWSIVCHSRVKIVSISSISIAVALSSSDTAALYLFIDVCGNCLWIQLIFFTFLFFILLVCQIAWCELQIAHNFSLFQSLIGFLLNLSVILIC